MTVDLITLGDLVADLVVPIESLPLEAQKHQPAEYIRVEPGGIGNTLVMAQRLGLKTKAIGSVGDDVFGRTTLSMLAEEGVDLSLAVELPNAATPTALVIVDKQAEHVFVGQFGTGDPLPYDPQWQAEIAQAGSIFIDGYCLRESGSLSHPSLNQCLQIAKEAGVPLFFDLGPAYTSASRDHVDQVLNYTTVFLATDEELCAWTAVADPIEAAHAILKREPTAVVIKTGGQGCRIVTQESVVDCPGFEADVVDTAGAGDAFAAGYIYGYLKEYAVEKIGELANAVGAATVSKLGTGTALPNKRDVDALLKNR